ncbi:MAG: peptidase M48, partial [SAR86 cluster bacterium]
KKVLLTMSLYEDQALQDYVNEVGQRVAKASHRPNLEYHFNIIDSPDINAFALPGGYVYVNRGLLGFMNSEAELAAVLAHEVGHITARHSVQQQARGKLASTAASVGGFVTAVATGSGYIGSQISEVASIWAQTGLSGFGRDHELEADSLGAEYLYNAGYDPAAVIKVITVLKNQEDFNRIKSNNQASYHGLFATHPRNDTRLQLAVSKVGNLDSTLLNSVDESVFRNNIEGLLVGANVSSGTTETRNRYYQELLGYTLVFPNQWEISQTTTTATAELANVGSMRIEVQRMQRNIEPRVFIKEVLGIDNLQKSEALNQYRLIGHTGTVASAQTGQEMRIAVIYLGPRVFVFKGLIDDAADEDSVDTQLLATIRTFRAIQRGEVYSGNEMRIKYVQASEYFNFTELAKDSKLASYPEETLRLLNGYYPSGSPERGTWIKTVQ